VALAGAKAEEPTARRPVIPRVNFIFKKELLLCSIHKLKKRMESGKFFVVIDAVVVKDVEVRGLPGIVSTGILGWCQVECNFCLSTHQKKESGIYKTSTWKK
jgi:hypothetical protein